MRPGQAVTLNPSSPLTHTGQGPELDVRRRRRVLQVIPSGSSGLYAGTFVGTRRADGSSSDEPAAPAGTTPDECC